MTQMEAAEHEKVADIYSIRDYRRGGQGPTLEQRIWMAMRGCAGPTVPIVSSLGMPQVMPDAVGLAEFIQDALHDAIAGSTEDGSAGWCPPRERRGQPARNAYMAAEIAYIADIEDSDERAHDYLYRRVPELKFDN